MEPPTQENTAEGETLEMLLMKYNWAHDQLKDVAPANQKKKKVKKKPSRTLNKKKDYLKIKYSKDNISLKFSLEQTPQKFYSS